MGQQRVKLDGRAARDPFGGKDCRQHQCGKSPKILFRHEIEISYNVFFFTFSNLLSHILVQVQNERFHHQRHSPSSLQKLFSLYSSLGQFLGPCNFLAISLRAQKLVRKGSLLIPAPISSPLTQLQATQPQTDFRQLLKAETFLNRTISEIVNFPQKGYFEADIGFQNWRKELYPRVHL